MKPITISIVILCVSLLYVSCKKSNTIISPELSKLSGEELIERARYGNFPDINALTYINEQGDTISRDSFLQMDNIKDLAFDDYVDKNGIVRVTLIRKANEKDKEIRDRINLAISEGPPLKRININCDSLTYILDATLLSDQNNRAEGKEVDSDVDLKNLETVASILEDCGMPTTETVSRDNIMAIWLVLQHALPRYQRKYMPLLQHSAEIGDLDRRYVYMMEDRILVNERKPQLYGTQITTDHNGVNRLHKVFDPENLNKRRKEAGFEPIEEYLLEWNIEMDTIK